MVLWALLTPILIMFVGVGMDLGWYYLTVSRLQNAADAAVLAGAIKLTKENEHFNDYYVYSLTSKPTSDFNKDYTIYYIDSESKKYLNKQINETPGIAEAQIYANQNLSGSAVKGAVVDNWNSIKKNNGVTFESALYARKMDIDRKDNGIKYYKVTLTEKVSHLFLSGLDPMEAKVVAYALLKPHDTDLVTTINQFEKTKVIANWMYQDTHRDAHTGNWNHYRQSISGSSGQKNIAYKSGDAFRTETVNVQIEQGASTNNTGTSSGQTTSANGWQYYEEKEVDSLNIDFNQDVQFASTFTTKDWDLRTTDLTDIPKITYRGMAGWSETHGYDLRIQGLINFNAAWRNRHLLDDDTTNNADEPDILWTRIEGDPIWSDSRSNNEKSLNSVHQMIINVHADNTATKIVKDTDDNDQLVYTYRPFFIFYMGPEVNDKQSLMDNAEKTFAENTAVRKSQPVIVNLYEDWNAILYMPNSPVIINGNGHKLTGFVIAKEYLQLKDESDFRNYYSTATDDYDNEIYVKKSDTISENDFKDLIKENKYSVDENTYPGYSILFEKIEAPHRPIISVSKEAAQNYGSFTEYVNATYYNNFKAYSGLSDEEIAIVTIPEEGYTGTPEYYAVEDAALKESTPTDSDGVTYVKVLKKVVVDDEETAVERYVDKAKLPYVKVRRDDKRSYVSVCDLQRSRKSTVYGVNTVDDSSSITGNNSGADLWRPSTDTYNSDRFVNKTSWDNVYKNEYIDSKLIIGSDTEGLKYFMLKAEDDPELVDEYHKIIFKHSGAEDEIRYISEKTKTYYIKVVPGGSSGKNAEGADVENAIIIDNKGDLQVREKPLSEVANMTRPTNEYEQPDDLSVYRTLHDNVTGDLKDYRDLNYEVVYDKEKAFTLKKLDEELPNKTKAKLLEKYAGKEWSEIMNMDSYYSYFLIPNLKRINYLYLNVNELKGTVNGQSAVYNGKDPIIFADDMFFTTKRASWID